MTKGNAIRLMAGPISNRRVYRWLRRLERMSGDVHLDVRWWPTTRPRDLPPSIWSALHDLDMRCKTLDDETMGKWGVRTRCWRGTEKAYTAWFRRGREPGELSDRELGLEYARLIGRVLREAHRAGLHLYIRWADWRSSDKQWRLDSMNRIPR